MADTTVKPTHFNFKDLTGETYARWTVLYFVEIKNGITYWMCRCLCGTVKPVMAGHLRGGKSQSCGCLSREITSRVSRTHGATTGGQLPEEYMAWQRIKDRCFNTNAPKYRYYGGRGIAVCKEWRNDFQKFFDYVGKRPSPKHSLDRYPNQDGDYEPGNVRWATWTEQQRNRRNNRMLTINGEVCCMAEWSQRSGMSQHAISGRLKDGMTPEEAVFGKRRKTGPHRRAPIPVESAGLPGKGK